MATASWQPSIAFTLREEGDEYVDDPQDPGGATRYGITIPTLTRWYDRPCTKLDIESLTPAIVTPLYAALYWNTVNAPMLPPGADLMIFDMGVNAGPRKSAELLQEALDVDVDGFIGPQTLGAVSGSNVDMLSVINAIKERQDQFYRSRVAFKRFGDGWEARLGRRFALACNLAGLNDSAPMV